MEDIYSFIIGLLGVITAFIAVMFCIKYLKEGYEEENKIRKETLEEIKKISNKMKE